ncbi:hypothetical protein [Ancylomarina sp. 16SWW S1-10-2]|uniref:hypothetical protein n=1 Tax=Ancylomarina sp. 16SWW S1-10-2 TaxID=2499681 RepID=UPI0012ADFA62|nr:hypothetical protein [Ancylomarina sp. 16SWW S1-10-2]MRT93122.1 hypothetical protein [Ancylomarina sp. 16SWW S1-10-2]
MNYKIGILSTLLLLFSFQAFSSPKTSFYPDTLRMQMYNGTTIEYRCNYNGDKSLVDNLNINKALDSFMKRWAVLHIKNLDQNKAMHIKCGTTRGLAESYAEVVENTISIEEMPIPTKVIFPTEESVALLIKGKHKLDLSPELAIYFDSLEQLKELESYDFSKILAGVDLQMTKNSGDVFDKVPLVSWMKVKEDDSVDMIYTRRVLPHPNDMILINGGVTLENVKGEWNGGFYADMIFQMGSKLLYKQAFKVGYEWMYDFSSGKQNINHWVSLGYSRNFSLNPSKPDWYGLNIGYLAKGNGDLFKKDSFRLGVSYRIHNNVTLVPQMYFNDLFKNVTPGLKLRINL